MKEVFEQYGGIMITVVAVLALLVVVKAVIGNSAEGILGKAFTGLIDNFTSQATAVLVADDIDLEQTVQSIVAGQTVA